MFMTFSILFPFLDLVLYHEIVRRSLAHKCNCTLQWFLLTLIRKLIFKNYKICQVKPAKDPHVFVSVWRGRAIVTGSFGTSQTQKTLHSILVTVTMGMYGKLTVKFCTSSVLNCKHLRPIFFHALGFANKAHWD